MTAKHFEAKLYAMRRNKDGLVISFVVHPSDITSDILTPDIGTRYMVAVAEIGDDEQPETFVSQSTPFIEAVKKEIAAKPHKPFASLPLSQQAALICGNHNFWAFLGAAYGRSSLGVADAAASLKDILAINSRGVLDSDHTAATRWKSLYAEYEAWLTTQKYGQAAR